MVDIDFIDTVLINECGLELIKQINVYKDTIEHLYNRINNIPTKTHEWIGNSSNLFIEKFNNDYKLFINIYDILMEYSNSLVDLSNMLDDAIKKVNND